MSSRSGVAGSSTLQTAGLQYLQCVDPVNFRLVPAACEGCHHSSVPVTACVDRFDVVALS